MLNFSERTNCTRSRELRAIVCAEDVPGAQCPVSFRFTSDGGALRFGRGLRRGLWGTVAGDQRPDSVTAFDISAEAIKHASTYYSHSNLSYSVASAEGFAFNRQFDVVTCFELIEHVEYQQRVVQNIAAALKDDGLLVISTPRPLDKVRSAFHAHELSLLDFSRILGCSFPFVEWFFENNHFASLVAGSMPKSIEDIYALHPQFELGQADYFIAVASRRQLTEAAFATNWY